jgi:hypothetical protein
LLADDSLYVCFSGLKPLLSLVPWKAPAAPAERQRHG